MTFGEAMFLVVATFLGQTVSLPIQKNSTRMMIGTWLVFALIVSTAYKGNLIASLALPQYPPRPENLEQLVKAVDSITMPSYGAVFLDFLKGSESESFRAWGEMMTVGVSVVDGLKQAAISRQAHVDGRRYVEQMVAEHFTEADGTSRLYVGHEGVLPGSNAWPIPHDAPYKPAFDAVITAVLEAGLYNKWMADMLAEARRQGRRQRQEQLRQEEQRRKTTKNVTQKDKGGVAEEEGEVADAEEEVTGWTQALTLVHLQGPIFLLALGLGLALVIFILEILVVKINSSWGNCSKPGCQTRAMLF